jgi:peptidoglycan hydrolase CwlO-like protein
MNARFTAIAASFAVIFATGVYAQGSPNASGSSGQGGQSQKQQIDQQHQAALKKCDSLKDNARDLCKAEADGQQKVAEAQTRVNERDTPKNRLDLAEAKADADYKVAKAKCGDQVGDAKNACEQEAKAVQNLAKARAKRESLAQTSSTGGTSSGSSGGQSTSASGTSGGQSPSSSSSSSMSQMPSPTQQQQQPKPASQ